MTIWSQVYPRNPAPIKSEIERMVRMSYLVDPSILRPEDVVNFGIDLHLLKEFGKVRMSKPLPQIRRLVPGLWGRMSPDQRTAFLLSYVVGGLKYVEDTLADLEREAGELPEVRQGISLAVNGLFSKIPGRITKRIGDATAMWKTDGESP